MHFGHWQSSELAMGWNGLLIIKRVEILLENLLSWLHFIFVPLHLLFEKHVDLLVLLLKLSYCQCWLCQAGKTREVLSLSRRVLNCGTTFFLHIFSTGYLPTPNFLTALCQQGKRSWLSISKVYIALKAIHTQGMMALNFPCYFCQFAQTLTDEVVDTPEHRQLALQAAHQLITLLKNDDAMLPLDPSKVCALLVPVWMNRLEGA